MTESYNRRRNIYRQQLPMAVDPVPIEMQIEGIEVKLNEAVAEIRAIFEELVKEKVIVTQQHTQGD